MFWGPLDQVLAGPSTRSCEWSLLQWSITFINASLMSLNPLVVQNMQKISKKAQSVKNVKKREKSSKNVKKRQKRKNPCKPPLFRVFSKTPNFIRDLHGDFSPKTRFFHFLAWPPLLGFWTPPKPGFWGPEPVFGGPGNKEVQRDQRRSNECY